MLKKYFNPFASQPSLKISADMANEKYDLVGFLIRSPRVIANLMSNSIERFPDKFASKSASNQHVKNISCNLSIHFSSQSYEKHSRRTDQIISSDCKMNSLRNLSMRTLRYISALIIGFIIPIPTLHAFDTKSPLASHAALACLQPWATFQEPISRAFGPSGTAAIGRGYYTGQWNTINGTVYLAVGGAPGQDNLRVLRFDTVTGTITALPGATFNSGSNIFSLAWFTIGATTYLVAAGDVASSISLQVFQFNANTNILTLNASYNHGKTIWAVSPINIAGVQYIALGGQQNALSVEGTILLFNPTSLSLTPVTNIPHGNTIKTLTWNTINGTPYLAIGGSNGTNDIETRIYKFTPPSTLTPVGTFNFGNTVWSLGWFNFPPNYYLSAVGGNGTSGSNVSVLQFDPLLETLTLISLFDHGNITMTQAWQIINGTNYLAIGGGKNNNEVGIYARLLVFDQVAGTLAPSGNTATITNINTVWSEDWLISGANFFLSLVGFPTTDGITIRIYKFAFSSLTLVANFFHTANGNIYSVSWQDIGDNSYLAIAGTITTGPIVPPFVGPLNASLRVLLFDPTTATLTSMAAYLYNGGLANIRGIDWLSIGNNYYIAFAGEAIGFVPPFNQIRILQFVIPNTITGPLATYDQDQIFFPQNATCVKWLTFSGRYFLAFGINPTGGNTAAKVLEFDPNTNALTLVASYNFGPALLNSVEAVDWIVIDNIPYLAAGGGANTVGSDIYSFYIFTFDPTAGTLTRAAAGPNIFANDVKSLNWLIANNIPYLAIGGLTPVIIPQDPVQVVQFDPVAGTVTLVPNGTFPYGNDVYAVSWKKANGTNYLAVGGLTANPDGTIQVRVLQFSPGNFLREIQNFTHNLNTFIYSVSWLEKFTNLYLGIGGFGDGFTPQVQALAFVP